MTKALHKVLEPTFDVNARGKERGSPTLLSLLLKVVSKLPVWLKTRNIQ